MINYDPKNKNSIWAIVDKALEKDGVITEKDLGVKIDMSDRRIQVLAGTLMAAGYSIQIDSNRMLINA